MLSSRRAATVNFLLKDFLDRLLPFTEEGCERDSAVDELLQVWQGFCGLTVNVKEVLQGELALTDAALNVHDVREDVDLSQVLLRKLLNGQGVCKYVQVLFVSGLSG